MDENRFQELLQKYLDETASDPEIAELMRLYRDRSKSDREALENSFNKIPAKDDEKMTPAELEEVKGNLQAIITSAPRIKRFRILQAAAVVLLITIAGLWLYTREPLLNESTASEKVYSFSGKNFLTLTDGTKVLMNEGSTLTYSTSFGKDDRQVTLSGEAYFDVAHDASQPFKVQTGTVVTRVLGTAFYVNADQQNKVTVTVVRGKVAVGNDKQTFGTLTPNEQIAVNTTNFEFVKSHLGTEYVAEWRNSMFILDDVTFEQAALEIEKRFKCKVTITNNDLKKCKVIAWYLNNESLSQIVEGLGSLQQATVTIDGNHVTIKGGIGCK
jgi:transmembrane sensor